MRTPTLAAFWPRFMEGYALANREKPNTIATHKRIWTKHVEPALGALALDAITDEEVRRFKGRLSDLAPKTVNCILTNLRRCLAVAVEWRVVPAMPCRIRQLKSARPIVAFYEDAEYERLVEVQRAISDDGSVTPAQERQAKGRPDDVLGLQSSIPDSDEMSISRLVAHARADRY